MSLGNHVFPLLNDFAGNLGFHFKDLCDAELFTINTNKVFSAASVIKIPLCLTVLEQCEKGKYHLEDLRPISSCNKVGGTGVIQNLNDRYIPTIGELITLAISVSDNIATNELIDLVGGPEVVNDYCQNKGIYKTKLQRKMLDLEARKVGKDNWMTVGEVGKLLEEISNAIYGGDDKAREMVRPLFKGMVMQQCRNKIPAKIPAFDYYDLTAEYLPTTGQVLVANKTGDLWTTQNDVAICALPNGVKYIVAICTDELKIAQQGIETIGNLSKAVYDYMCMKYSL